MTGIHKDSKDEVFFGNIGSLDADQTTAYSNFTPPRSGGSIILERHVSLKDLELVKSDLMPGFKFSWWYTGPEVTTESKYKDKRITKQFIR